MKITPLLLFLILLVVLVLSLVLCKHCFGGKSSAQESSSQEGFVSFDTNTASLDEISIPQYSKTAKVSKLYDNLYFDSANGNLIEVNAPNYVEAEKFSLYEGFSEGASSTPTTGNNSTSSQKSEPSSVKGNASVQGNTPVQGNASVQGNVITSNKIDYKGNSIININITTRVGNSTKSYNTDLNGNAVVAKTTTESEIKNVVSSYENWTYTTKSKNTSTYQVFYMPWDTKTYMHIVRLKSAFDSGDAQNMYTFKYASGSTPEITRYINEPMKLTSQEPDKDPNNNKYVVDPYYDKSKKVYQLSKYVKFDASNGELIIRSNNSITVYNRYNTTVSYNTPDSITNTSSSIKSVSYSPFVISDNYQNEVLYIPDGKNTIIALFQMDPANKGQYKIANLARFTETGLDDGTTSNDAKDTKDEKDTKDKKDTKDTKDKKDASGNNIPVPPSGSDENTISNYYKWYWYWKSSSENTANSASKYSDDYILKTQIVPPVCPSCPSCTGNGSCTNCGGQGGCGTLNANGSTVVSGNTTVPNMPTTNASNYQMPAQTIQTPPDDSLKIQASGSKGAPRGPQGPGIVNNTVDTAGKIVGGTVDTAGKVVGGTVGAVAGVANNAINTVGKILTQGQGQGQGSNSLYSSSGNTGSLQSAGAAAIPGQGQAVSGSTPIDNYSRYGALVSKGSNFIPITSDFSQFGK